MADLLPKRPVEAQELAAALGRDLGDERGREAVAEKLRAYRQRLGEIACPADANGRCR